MPVLQTVVSEYCTQRHRLDTYDFKGSPLIRPSNIFVPFFIPVGSSSGLSPWCDPLAFVPTVYVTTIRIHVWSRALSHLNLVSGYECGRVFLTGVGPGSPSRDAANWLSSRFGLSVETRRQYDWLRMVFSGVRLFRAPIWWHSEEWRHARGREQCRGEAGSSLTGGYVPDSAKAEDSSIVDEPGEVWTPVHENRKREPGGFWGKSWSLTTVIFLSTRATWSGERARFVGLFLRMHRALDGWMLARAPASLAQGLHHHGRRYFNFPYFCPWESWDCWSKLVGTY